MPGVAGRSGGANRKRSDEKLGHPKYAEGDSRNPGENVDKPKAQRAATQPKLVFPSQRGQVVKPEQMTLDLWESMAVSGFNEYYTQADWHAAVILMYNLDQMIKEMIGKGSLSAMKMSELRAVMSDLLVLESSRRRLRLEVQRAEAKGDAPETKPSHMALLKSLA
jgi:hypothetical protein